MNAVYLNDKFHQFKVFLLTVRPGTIRYFSGIILILQEYVDWRDAMNDIAWHKLRTLHGSQQAAFEELCCQLAAGEKMAPGSQFIRVGAPDAGVECYWHLPQGEEHGWQAKFFPVTPQNTQWKEVDESIKTALEKHPRLTKYTICFPLDRADPRRDDALWFMDKWNQRVAKWKSWAQAKGISVEFDYWGEHELLLRLSKEEHRGRYFFWFHQACLSDDWFQQRLDEALVGAGARYTPVLNLDLPIAHFFNGLGRTAAFFERIEAQVTVVMRTYRSLLHSSSSIGGEEARHLTQYLQDLLVATTFQRKDINPINWAHILHLVTAVYQEANNWAEKLMQGNDDAEHNSSSIDGSNQQQRQYETLAYQCRQLMRALRSLEDMLDNNETQLTNTPALLLVGDAGKGKTHLLCDIALNRQKQALPTLLLLGEKFQRGEPWAQIITLLALSCDRDEFLGALNTAGEVRQQRALILIDALNESEEKWFWTSFLTEMLTTLSRYPWIGIAISIRSSYEDAIIPKGLVPHRLIRIVHKGFVGYEYEATKIYFDHYGIERPSIPLMLPEFQNPLFLKLFCQGLQAGNYTRIPEGLHGITAIFTFFLETLNTKLTDPRELDLNPYTPYVQQAVQALARALAKKQTRWLPHGEAQKIVNCINPSTSYHNSLFRRLITEGVLSEDRFPVRTENDEQIRYVEGIRFTYERFSDHLIAQYLLEQHFNPEDSNRVFQPDEPLGRLISAQWQNRGLIEALSIQIPELFQKELCDLLPVGIDNKVFRAALIESLLWRDPSSITSETLQCIIRYASPFKSEYEQFLCVLLTVAMNPRHPLNANYLHTILMKMPMAERDATWSIFLHNQAGNGLESPVNRLIDWAWKPEERSFLVGDSLRLAGIILCWIFTTSHRPLRDRATKATVQLLEKHLSIVTELVNMFAQINDSYVSERIYAVAYGCAMRSTDRQGLGILAQNIYDLVFRNACPPSHLLLRDYARGVVERALALQLSVTGRLENIRPPYQSDWPEVIPSEQEVDLLLGGNERANQNMSFKERGLFALSFSLEDWGDFTRYVINANSHKWLARRLTDTDKPNKNHLYEQFMNSLTPKQQRAIEDYRHTVWQEHAHQLANVFSLEDNEDHEGEEILDQPLQAGEDYESQSEQRLETAEQQLHRILGKRKTTFFKEQGFSWFSTPAELEENLDLKVFQYWITKQVFEIGWTMDRFGEFDALVDHQANGGGGRSPDKPERIGKKYQWIAYYDILARATDTFLFRDDDWKNYDSSYEGPWQMSGLRNIDPSFLLKSTQGDSGLHTVTNTWWCVPTPRWVDDLEDKQWLQEKEALVDPSLLIEVTYPADNSNWLTLHGHYIWKQPLLFSEEDRNGPQGREIWYFLESCLVKREDIQRIWAWAKKHDFSEEHLPQSTDWHHDELYFGELYWSPCYLYYYTRTHQYTEWTQGEKKYIPAPVLLTAEQYHWTRHFDCSIDEKVSCMVPSKFIVDRMNLQWNGQDGQFITPDGVLCVFDPSIKEKGPSVLLMRKDAFLEFLQDNNLAILWTIRGEKNAYGKEGWPQSFAGRFTINGGYMYSEQGVLQGGLSLKDSDASK